MPAIKNLQVKCGYCGTYQRSAIGVDSTEALERISMRGNRQQCGKCGKMFHCNKENFAYTLADGSGGSVAPDFIDNKAS